MTALTDADRALGLAAVVASQADTIRRLATSNDAAHEDLRLAIRRLGESRAEVLRLADYRQRAEATEAELAELRELINQQQELIAAHQHASVLAHHAYRALALEADRLRGMIMGGIIVLAPPPGGWRN
ncbi:MAG: hypothetical protein DYG90_00415 [Chloroflexi bacterium CFX6]|nr:hypothetical protein [Chloroflexi bacterium CFX6]